jgi:hypothetical protein
MTFVFSVLSLLLVVAVTAVLFAGIGRAAVPARERTPVARWGWRDVYGNVAQGLRVCSDDSPLATLMRKTPPGTAEGHTDPPGRDQA